MIVVKFLQADLKRLNTPRNMQVMLKSLTERNKITLIILEKVSFEFMSDLNNFVFVLFFLRRNRTSRALQTLG